MPSVATDRQRRHAETLVNLRAPNTHDPDADADQNKRKERAGCLVISPTTSSGMNAAKIPVNTKNSQARLVGCLKRGMHIGEDPRHEAVAKIIA